jgi:hypothetical protein
LAGSGCIVGNWETIQSPSSDVRIASALPVIRPERCGLMHPGDLPLLGMLAAGVSPANATVLQIEANAPFVCAAVEGGDTANGSPVLAYSCSVAFDQQWNYVEGQFYGLGTANGVGKCLNVKGAATEPGTLVDLYDCTGGQNQQWKIINGADIGLPASTLIRSNQTDLCLDSAGPSVGGGKELVMHECTGATSQNWNLRNIHFQINSGPPYVCAAAEGAFTANGTPVLAYSCSGDIPRSGAISKASSKVLARQTEDGACALT